MPKEPARWIEAPEVRDIAERLIPKYHSHLMSWAAEIRYVFRNEAQVSKGKTVWGKAHKISALPCYLATNAPGDANAFDDIPAPPADMFVMEIALPVWEKLTHHQREALVDHELCFPAGVTVAGPTAVAGSARRYAGHLVTIRTAAGNLLTTTPNHPVLTDRGWVMAGFLQEGDHVLRCADPERVAAAVDPDEHQVPAFVEQVASALDVRLRLVPEAPEDFYTNIPHGEVDVVGPDGPLLTGNESSGLKHSEHVAFSGRDAIDVSLPRGRRFGQFLRSVLRSSPSRIRLSNGFHEGGSFLGPLESQGLRLGPVSAWHASLIESSLHSSDAGPKAGADRQHGLASGVALYDAGNIQGKSFGATTGSRWPSESSGFTSAAPLHTGLLESEVDGRAADAESLAQRLHGLASGVAFDEIVHIKVEPFRGHVYSLQTSEGWVIANGIVTHNCHFTIEFDDKDGLVRGIKAHDVEEFRSIAERHGAWKPDLAEFAEALQLSLNVDAMPGGVRLPSRCDEE